MEECTDKNNVDKDMTDSNGVNFKENFYRRLVEHDEQHQGSHRKAWTSVRILEVINDIKKARVTQRKTAMDYYWMSKYDIITIANENCLIFKKLTATAPTVRILPREQYFDVLSDIHNACGHGGRDKILFDLKNKYYIPKKAVEVFVSLCPTCETKKNAPRKTIITKPVLSRDFNLRGQVNLIDFQSCPDGEFNWLLNYQDNATKFLNLRPLKSERPVEIASELMKIFLTFGAPRVLQSDIGHEIIVNVIKELVTMWPECKIVHENLCHSTEVSVEIRNLDIENMLRVWMNENKSTNWSLGCFFVQYNKNASCHPIIEMSPYKALFGNEPQADLNGSDISSSMLSTVEPEGPLKTNTEREPAQTTNSDSENINRNFQTVMKNTENSQSILTCAVCHNNITGAYKCEFCNSIVRETCARETVSEKGYESKVVSNISKDIKTEVDKEHKDEQEKEGLKRVAEKVIDTTVKKMPKLEIGNYVLLSVPKVDRGPEDVKHIQGKIVDLKNGVHKVGTKFGTIKNWFSRQDLQYLDTNSEEEILESPITLKEAVASQLCYGNKALQKCSCKPAVNQCRNNRCTCFKNKVLCGSKCHGNVTCVNE